MIYFFWVCHTDYLQVERSNQNTTPVSFVEGGGLSLSHVCWGCIIDGRCRSLITSSNPPSGNIVNPACISLCNGRICSCDNGCCDAVVVSFSSSSPFCGRCCCCCCNWTTRSSENSNEIIKRHRRIRNIRLAMGCPKQFLAPVA